MSFETDPKAQRDPHGAAALAPLLWIFLAALTAVALLMLAPVPPL
jgi:hypothetical protein